MADLENVQLSLELKARVEPALVLLEAVPGSDDWDDALRALSVDGATVPIIAAELDARLSRRFLTAHAVAAAVRRSSAATTRSATALLAELGPLIAEAGLDSSLTLGLAETAAAAAGALDRLKGRPLASARARVWSACFGSSLYTAAWYAADLRDQSVMIVGETGTGKELVARTFGQANLWFAQTLRSHPPPTQQRSETAPFVPYNAAALATSNAEGELFGWVKGAFSGAISDRVGLIEAAHGGTLFLDEIGDMSRELHAKLLRAIESREITPLGSKGGAPRRVLARWITATSKDVDAMVADGRFSEDLRRRLSGLVIHLPALREWPVKDVCALARSQLVHDDAQPGQPAATGLNSPAHLQRLRDRFDRELGAWLLAQPRTWPGNTRQLFQIVRTWKLQGPEQSRTDLERVPGFEEAPRRQPAIATPREPVVAAIHDRIVKRQATLEELEAWYLACLEEEQLTTTEFADRLGVSYKTVGSMQKRAKALIEALRARQRLP